MGKVLRASTSVDANFSSILHKKSYFFYFTYQFLQNTHISLSSLHIYLKKYSFFYNFLLFPPSPPLSLTNSSLPTITPHPATIIIKENQPSQSETHSSPTQPGTHCWFDRRGLMIGEVFIWWFDRRGFVIGMVWWLVAMDDRQSTWFDDLSVAVV